MADQTRPGGEQPEHPTGGATPWSSGYGSPQPEGQRDVPPPPGAPGRIDNPYAPPAPGSQPLGSPYLGSQPQPAPPPGAYGQSPYAQQPYGRPGGYAQGYPAYAGRPPQPDPSALAGWGARVGASLLDNLLVMVPLVVVLVGVVIYAQHTPRSGFSWISWEYEPGRARPGDPTMMTVGRVVAIVGCLTLPVAWVWNRVFHQGRTGQSWGKKVVGIALVDELSGQPVGAGKAFLRELAHYLDKVSFYLGFLWPLWDARRQTLADKICQTLVVTRR